MQNKKWGIVGGGMMGMTIAHRLAQQGHDVTIFEAAPEVGGLASSWMMNDVEWDKFYHVILLSDFYTRGILRDIGVEHQLKWVETKTGFYMGGKLHSMSNSIEFLKFPTLNLIDKFRLGLTIIAASKIKDWRKLEKVPVTTWLKRWSGHNTYQKIWLPLLRAKLGDSYERTSAVFIWATIQRLYGARRSGLKKEMFGYVQGGYRTINNAFQKTLQSEGVSIKTKARVSEISSVNGVATIRLENEKFDFDEVVVTGPGMLAASLIPSLSEVEKKKLQNVEYLGVICVALLLNKPVSPYYITNITDTKFPFTGVIEMTALVDPAELKGNHLVYLPKYITADDPLFERDDIFIRDYFLKNFLEMYPAFNETDIRFAGVAKAKQVITVAAIDYSARLPKVKTSLPNIHIINTAHIKDGTLNVNETIRVAETKLNEILNP
ncbi:MAG: NAD(P)/FAD-dependent oxidoreductase [Chitinophagaceae bacterium]|nr:NAD(P)/FAD-dependent oxidoreductase [Chitinophagaceae bacterium]